METFVLLWSSLTCKPLFYCLYCFCSAKAFLEWSFQPKNETRWECVFLPDNGAFYVNYVITSALVGTALELVRFPELLMYALRLCCSRSPAELAGVRQAIFYEFPFGINYAWMLTVFATTIIYSISCPIITVFGIIFLVSQFIHIICGSQC